MGLGFRPRLSRPVQNGVELYFQIFSSVPSEQGRHWQFLGVCSSYPLSRDGFAVRTRRARVRARKPGNFPSAEKTTRCALYRLATAPISRSHSPSVPRKPEIARLLPAESRRDTRVSFAALGVVHVSDKTARYEDVRSQRIVFPPHFPRSPYSLPVLRRRVPPTHPAAGDGARAYLNRSSALKRIASGLEF